MTGGGTVIFNQTGASTYSGTISGTGGFTKDGAGVLKFTRSQTYTGATLISNGTLQMEIVASPNPSGNLAAASAVTNNATLSFNASAFNSSYSFGASVAGTGNLLVTGIANPYLAGTNTYSGTTTINAGAMLNIGNTNGSGATGSLGTGAVVNNGSLGFTRSGTVNVPNDISGSGALTINGSSTNTFSGNNSFSGNVTVGQTVNVVLGSATAMGTGSTIFLRNSPVLRYTPSNTVDYSARISIAGNSAPVIDTNGQDVTWANAPSSTSLSALIKDGAGRLLISGGLNLPGGSIITLAPGLTVRGGTLVLEGANTIGNGITINAGAALQIGNAGTTGDLGGTTTVTNNGTLTFNRSNLLSISNVINGTGDLVKAGAGALSLLGANGYTGNTTLSAGTLSLDSSSALGYGGTISQNNGCGAELRYCGYFVHIGRPGARSPWH
jgi:autotransporter-associated beta strand protein